MTQAPSVLITACARRGRPRDERLDQEIAQAAVAVLADEGFDRFSVEAVALRAGVAKTTIYRRFPSRGDLVAAALDHLGEESPPPLEGTARDRIRSLVAAIRAGGPGSARGRILMHAAGADDPALAELVYERVLSGRSRLLRDAIAHGMESGELRADLNVDATMAVLVGPMLYLSSWRNRESVKGVTVDEVVDLVMTGLTRATGS